MKTFFERGRKKARRRRMADLSHTQLIEKIVRAKVALEGATVRHKEHCATEDPDSTAPCNCGASAANAGISRALRELALD